MSQPIHLTTFGDGPTNVVLLHGCPTPPSIFEPLAREIAAAGTHRAIIVDLPGYGRSAPVPGPDVFGAGTRAIEAALKGAGATKTALVGYSLGAYRAFLLARLRTLDVTHVFALAGYAELAPEERAGMREIAKALRAGADLRPMLPARMMSPAYAAAHPEHAKEIEAWADATGSENLAAEIEAAAACEDLRGSIAELQIPVVARVGSLDVAAPQVHSENIVNAAQRGSLEVVRGVGHAVLYEDFEGTLASIRRALS